MAAQAISEDYGTTVSPARYVSGIMVHVWLAAMYELMIQSAAGHVSQCMGANPKKNVLVYDLGCGPGHFTMALAERIFAELKDDASRVSIVGIDNSPAFLAHAFNKSFDMHPEAKRLVRFEEGDVLELQREPADIITVSGFVHHFPLGDQPRVLEKIASLLKKGGVFIHGDEHMAPSGWFDAKFPGHGRALSLCALYFQVIAGAGRSKSDHLERAETENFLAEVYRVRPEGVPMVEREKLLLLVREHARMFMEDLTRDGLEVVCRDYALPLFDEIEKAAKTTSGNPGLYDRGDFKVPLRAFTDMAEQQGLRLEAIYDTGNHRVLGSAPVTVFQKK